jgi:acetylornithine/N-succinyldiaminopimelate aminotransferase
MTTPAPPPLNPLLEAPGEYAFVALDRKRRELAPSDVPTIHFGIGDPRERTPAFIRDALRAAVPEVSSYPAVIGLPELRAAAAGWLERRFGVRVDPETELLPVNGTKEGVFLLAFAVVGRDSARDTIVIPTPAYPVYEPAARFAGARPHLVPLRAEDGFRFRPELVPDEIWHRTALLWLNAPHNPTGAVLDRAALGAIAVHARTHGYWVAADEAYAEIWFDRAPGSMLEHGTPNVIAFHTLSKRSAMTGYRSGFMAGDPRLIAALRAFRPNIGVATPEFVQRAAIAAWSDDVHAAEQRALYAAKRAVFLEAFERLGWKVEASEATFYLWARAPGGDDVAFVERLLRLGLVAAPGSYFGPGGEGYVRWALVPTLDECRAAVKRLETLLPSGEGDR